MNLTPVQSSNIRAVGYDAATQTLHVQFPSGVYEVSDVTQDQYDAFMQAESKGKHYNEHFKGGKVRKV